MNSGIIRTALSIYYLHPSQQCPLAVTGVGRQTLQAGNLFIVDSLFSFID